MGVLVASLPAVSDNSPAFPLLHHHACHALDTLRPVVLIVRLPRHVLQILHVCPHQHVPQQQEVGVRRVLHWPRKHNMTPTQTRLTLSKTKTQENKN